MAVRVSRRSSSRFVCAALAALLLASPCARPASAESEPPSQAAEAGSNFGIGVVTVLANVVYMPVKLVYGILGGVTGGLAYVLSGANRQVADGVWVPSMGGDYVLTTEMMTGREEVRFNGVRSSRPTKEQEEDESQF